MGILFVFLNVQLWISLRIGNLQMLLETELLKNKQTNKQQKQNKIKKKKKIKIALSQGYPSSCFHNKRCNVLL